MTSAEALACAAAEGLQLVPKPGTATGYKGVSRNGNRFLVKQHQDGRSKQLGNFGTPEEAALCYARASQGTTVPLPPVPPLIMMVPET